MNRVQKQHNFNKIFYLKKIWGKVYFSPARLRALARAAQTRTKKIVNNYNYGEVYFY